MMLYPRWQRCRPTDRRRASVVSKLEILEGRALLSHVIFHSPSGSAPVQVAAAHPIATVAETPRVALAQFQAQTGQVIVQFTADPDGYNLATLTNPANYSLSPVSATSKSPKTKAVVVQAPNYQVTAVALVTPTTPGAPPTVVVSIGNNQPLRGGNYQFTIRSAGLVDLTGRTLNGSFTGKFPTGTTQGGGDFSAILGQAHNTVLPMPKVSKHR